MQTALEYGRMAVDILGCVCGIATCVAQIVARLGKAETPFGHRVNAIGIDLAKFRKAAASVVGEE